MQVDISATIPRGGPRDWCPPAQGPAFKATPFSGYIPIIGDYKSQLTRPFQAQLWSLPWDILIAMLLYGYSRTTELLEMTPRPLFDAFTMVFFWDVAPWGVCGRATVRHRADGYVRLSRAALRISASSLTFHDRGRQWPVGLHDSHAPLKESLAGRSAVFFFSSSYPLALLGDGPGFTALGGRSLCLLGRALAVSRCPSSGMQDIQSCNSSRHKREPWVAPLRGYMPIKKPRVQGPGA